MHVPASAKAFAYSDGDATEAAMLRTLRGVQDLSVYSGELAAAICDWPTKYHFSAQRAALLWPFRDFLRGKDVLEIGSGCGAMTRALAECGARVLALEGSARRAEITAARCRDLKDVSVYNDNFDDFATEERFDVVTLIGVLEYAASFIAGEDPYAAMLQRARGFLKPGGVLILAIENRLGLKYLNGVPEDHIGMQFGGLQDAYEGTGIRTFGRNELSVKLRAAGFTSQEFHFPFPDYKFPTLVIHPDALDEPRIRVADLICGNAVGPVAAAGPANFYDERAWAVLSENGLVRDFANSFLVFAGTDEIKVGCELASRVAPNRRAERFSGTTIGKSVDGALVVRKFADCHATSDCSQSTCPYVDGRLYMEGVFKAFQRGFSLERIAAAFRPWLEYLRSKSTGGGEMLPAAYFDCTPWNLLETEKGLAFFDQEPFPGAVSLHMVAFRGIAHSLGMLRYVHSEGPVPVLDLVKRIWVLLFGDDSRLDIDSFLEREYQMLCTTVINAPKSFADYRSAMGQAALLPFAVNCGDWRERGEVEKLVKTLSAEWEARTRFDRDCQKLEEQVKTVREALKSAQAALKSAQAARAKVEGDYAGLAKELKSQAAELERQRSLFENESVARAKLITDYRNLESLFYEARGRAETATRELAELKGGFCWKITSPLRTAKRKALQVKARIDNFKSRRRYRRNYAKMLRSLRNCEVVFDHNLGGGANDYRVKYVEGRIREGVPCVVLYNNMWYWTSRDFTLELHRPEGDEKLTFQNWDECRRFLDGLQVGAHRLQ